MIRWTITDNAGIIVETGFATPSADDHPRDCGFAWIEGEHSATVVGEVLDPLVEHWTGAAWTPDLDAIRLRRWSAVKGRRDQAEWGGCSTPHGRADTSPDSQRKISGAVQMALIAQAASTPFEIEWTMADNSVVTLDSAGMVSVGLAVGQHVNACHVAATAKRTAIYAASTAEEIDAVSVDDGWPSGT